MQISDAGEVVDRGADLAADDDRDRPDGNADRAVVGGRHDRLRMVRGSAADADPDPLRMAIWIGSGWRSGSALDGDLDQLWMAIRINPQTVLPIVRTDGASNRPQMVPRIVREKSTIFDSNQNFSQQIVMGHATKYGVIRSCAFG